MPTSVFDDISTVRDLHVALSRIDITVPGRIDGRTSQHTERWTICRLISTLSEYGRLAFPMSLTHGDRPDCLLSAGFVDIGVEVTEAVPPQWAEFCALRDREFPNALLELAQFRWGSVEKTIDETREILCSNQLTALGWAGDSVEREWAGYIDGAIRSKNEKSKKQGFVRHSQNWLAIYDNLPLPNVYVTDGLKYLLPMIQDTWSHRHSFDRVFIEHGPVVVAIGAGEHEILELKDLW